MPLPLTDQPWPPTALAPIMGDITTADAWWTGDPNKLTAIHGGPTPRGGRYRSFWSRAKQAQDQGKSFDRVHVPIASDIAATGADLLFGDEIDIKVPEAHGDKPDEAAVKAEARLLELADLVALQPTLLEAAEVCGALGGVYLRPTWDPASAAHPLLAVIHADRAVPEWRWGRLAAVTFWTVIATENDTVWRHLERHDPGSITTGLYAGDATRLGVAMPLDKRPETAGYEPEINTKALLGIDGILPRYVPNVRPNRRHRGTPHGRPDTQGLEPLMDALDEAMSSWMRDIELGKRRIIVPNEFLQRAGRGLGAGFDTDQSVFSPLDLDPAHAANAGITMVDFAIRTQDHLATTTELTRQIISSAGYSPQSFGMQGDGAAITATEVDANEGKSDRTTDRKGQYWRPQLVDVLMDLQRIDAAVFKSGVQPFRPQVEFGHQHHQDPAKTAETLNLIGMAQAASIETKVRMLHPEWETPQVLAEVAAIKAEQGLATDPTGGLP